MDRAKLIDTKKNPFYQHSKIKLWLAEQNGKIVGRIAGVINDNYIASQNDESGFFGFYESINDLDVAKRLFEPAEAWLRASGMKMAYGPANPSSNDEYGLLIDGFDRPPVMLMTYNPQYYSSLFEANGYRKDHDMFAYLMSQDTAASDKLVRVAEAMRERNRIQIRSFDTKNFDREVQLVKELYNAAWENTGFVPMTDPEIDYMAKDLKQVYDPELVLFAEVDGKTVGFALSMPDINQAFHAGPRIPRGAMNLPVGVWNLMTKKKAINTVRVILLGVLKEYRRRGIDALLFKETMERAKKKGYRYGEGSWVQETNIPMNRAAQMMNAEKYKTYRIYKKAL
jgi:GNAT superfamily N-acetyltransferase